jgi:hypothetical protein
MNKMDDTQISNLTITGSFTPPPSAIGSTQFNLSDPLVITKQRHKQIKVYAQDKGAVAATVTGRVIHVADSAGTVNSINVGNVVANIGAATIVFDLKKNGASILTGTITTTNAHAAYAKVPGSIATAAYVAGDVFEITVTATAGGGTLGQGPFASVVFDEAP